MEILAWNCRGLNNDAAVQALKRLIQQKRPSIVFLCETKVNDWEYMNGLRLQLGLLNCEAVWSVGHSGGLAMFWVDGLDVRFRSKSLHHIDVEVWATDGSHVGWRLTGFYGHPVTAERHTTWSLLRTLADESSLPWLGSGGGPYTWRGAGVCSRLDRAAASASLVDIFPGSYVLHLPPVHGDHVPILVGVWGVPPPVLQRRQPRFRFESFWTAHDGCREAVNTGWASRVSGRPMFQVVRKIRQTRFSVNSWQREVFGNRGREIELIRSRLQTLLNQPLADGSQEESMALNLKLDKLLSDEHAYWKQRSKITWLKDGDRNTKYFHRKASYRRAKNRLVGLFDSNGEWQSSELGLEQVILDYFSGMFKASEVRANDLFSAVDLIQPKVTGAMNDDLCAPYSAGEIKTALFQMYPTKAPGPDGMPPLFFQEYWDTMGDDVVQAVQNFLHTGQLLREIIFTHICLIPKVPNPETVADLRPIALCNVIYKICSKAITNRLKRVLSHLISPFQSAFILGRLITDTLIANEVSHFIHNCQSSSEGVFSLKLDMSKAYDRMEWKFLEAILLRFGFDEAWVHIIMQCVTTVRYAFLINGKPRGYLTPTRGLRQGDPLSPYLFLLCAEVFSALLVRKAERQELKGIRICPDAPLIHHLLFVDDSLLFGRATLEECLHIKSVLTDYEIASRQQVNFSKSSIVFSKKVNVSLQGQLANSLGVKIEAKHDKYLGLPTYLGRNRTEPFAYIKERLSKKLEGWQGKLLSSAGKDLLIRVVAQALPSYAMSCFLLPRTLCDSLHQMCARFWWGCKGDNRKIHWLSWEKLCNSKADGGMGFRDLYAHNLALLSKQGWRLIRYPESLVGRVLKARYFPSTTFLTAPVAKSPSACWRGIFEAKAILLRGIRWQVGDGLSIRIWEDPWVPRPFLFRPFVRRAEGPIRVADLLLPGGKWNHQTILEVFDHEDASLILSIPLSHRVIPDRLVWHFDSKGLFSTKSAYKLAVESSLLGTGVVASSIVHPSIWKKLWDATVPGKIKVHVWRVCANILPTVDKLRSKRVFLDQGCCFCNDGDESVEHISRDCSFVGDLLGCFPGLISVLSRAVRVGSMLDWVARCVGMLSSDNFALLMMVIWSVWKERKRVWSGMFLSLAQVFNQVRNYFLAFKATLHVKVSRVRVVIPWSLPQEGWLKANVDGAFSSVTGSGGFGVVVRNWRGQVVGGACCKVEFARSALMVEALAARAACMLAMEHRLVPIAFETDCQQLVLAVEAGEGEDASQIGRLVDDIALGIKSLHGSTLSHICRESNGVAHKLAQVALHLNFQVVWMKFLLLTSVLLLSTNSTTTQTEDHPPFLYTVCYGNGGNDSANSIYHTNLNQILADLSSTDNDVFE
ncbi:uncharacterized protein LOC133730987 [Rosa rugosa]|uniref:uncharacterized protein LOC133730987 n=1 Tax=Rosa rugosa TaxID=74645 RepID=UPI002B40AE99|nr:uncharacterized protein LOC133730987 [Rosa rugosa]